MGPIAKIFGGGSRPAPVVFQPAPPPPEKLDVDKAKRLRRGRVGKGTIKTGPLGVGDAEAQAASILGG